MKQKISLLLEYHREEWCKNGINHVGFLNVKVKNIFDCSYLLQPKEEQDEVFFLNDKKILCEIINVKEWSIENVAQFNKKSEFIMVDNTFSKQLEFNHSFFINFVDKIDSKDVDIRRRNLFNFYIFGEIVKDAHIQLFQLFGTLFVNGNIPFIKQYNCFIKMYILKNNQHLDFFFFVFLNIFSL